MGRGGWLWLAVVAGTLAMVMSWVWASRGPTPPVQRPAAAGDIDKAVKSVPVAGPGVVASPGGGTTTMDPRMQGIGMYERPGGVLGLRAIKAAQAGDEEDARSIWREITESDVHLLDRLGAFCSLASSKRKDGHTERASDLLREALEVFRREVGGLSPENPLDRIAAREAWRCAHLLDMMDRSVGPLPAADLVLAHRELFSSAQVHEAHMVRAQEFGLRGRDADVIAEVEASRAVETSLERRTGMWVSAQTWYVGAMIRAGRAAEAADHMVGLWPEAKAVGREHVDTLGVRLVNALRAAHRHDEAIDATWDVIAALDGHLSQGTLSDFNRRGLEQTRRSLLNIISASGTHGRPVDALMAIRRLKALGIDDPLAMDSLDRAEELAIREIERRTNGG